MSEFNSIDTHKLDKFAKCFANRSGIVLITILILLLGIGFSIQCNKPEYINRAGSLITIAGLLLTMSPIFINGIYKSQSSCGRWSKKDENGNLVTTTPQERYAGINILYGIVISIIGTIVSTFGDLIFS